MLCRKVFSSICTASLVSILAVTFGFGQKSATGSRSRSVTRPLRSRISKVRSNELTKLVERLRAKGAAVKYESERVSQPFFTVKARILLVEDQAIQVFQYANDATVEAEAQRVDPTGMTVGSSKISWMAPPHFYRRDKLIVLYVGNDSQVKSLLESVLGPQFAGG